MFESAKFILAIGFIISKSLTNYSLKINSFLDIYLMQAIGEKNYKCEHCFGSFTQKNDLIIHRRIHTGNSITFINREL